MDRLAKYDSLRPEIIRLLKDYFRKLETDDYDPMAIQKMKETNRVLDVLREEV